jgi:hypothetical protein
MKKYFHEIGKSYLAGLGAALLSWTLAAMTAVPKLVLGLSLTDTQVWYIRAGLALFGFLILAAIGWLLYFRTRWQLHLVQASSSDPFRVSDDFEFVTESGYWIQRKTGLRVCAKCLLPPTKIVSPLFEGLGSDLDGNPCMVWRCRHCLDEYWHENAKA